MNDRQLAYANVSPDIGHLLVQIDTYYQSLPDAVRRAFDNLGANLPYGCHVDLEEGQEPDGCVLDEGRPRDCIYADKVRTPCQCQYWRPISPRASINPQSSGTRA